MTKVPTKTHKLITTVLKLLEVDEKSDIVNRLIIWLGLVLVGQFCDVLCDLVNEYLHVVAYIRSLIQMKC